MVVVADSSHLFNVIEFRCIGNSSRKIMDWHCVEFGDVWKH